VRRGPFASALCGGSLCASARAVHRSTGAGGADDEDGGKASSASEDGGDGGDGNGRGPAALPDVRAVGEAVLRLLSAAGGAALALVPPDTLVAVLSALRPVINAGRDTLLKEGDSEGEAHPQAALAALEAATSALRLMTAAGAPQKGEALEWSFSLASGAWECA